MRVLVRVLAALIGWLIASPAFAQATRPRLESQASGTVARLTAISIVSPTVVWVSGAHGTYARTTDGGATWHARAMPGADSLAFTGVHATSADEAVLLSAGKGRRARIYRTTDGGATWTLAFQNTDSSAFYDCMAFRGATGVAISDAVGGTFPIMRTVDGGRSWTPFAPPNYAELEALDGEGAAAFGTCILVRKDGAVAFGTTKGGRIFRLWPDHSNVVQTPIVHGSPTSGILTLAFHDDTTGIAAGGDLSKGDTVTDNVVVTRDGGTTWTVAGHPPFPFVFALAYVPRHRRTVVAVSAKGSAWSEDDGSTWHALDDEDYWCVRFSATGVGWMVGEKGRITKITMQ